MKQFILSLFVIVALSSCEIEDLTDELAQNDETENVEDIAVETHATDGDSDDEGNETDEDNNDEGDETEEDSDDDSDEGNQENDGSKNDDPDVDETGITSELILGFITKGEWTVTKYFQKNSPDINDFTNTTDEFENYTFVFDQNGMVTAESDTMTFTSTWAISGDTQEGFQVTFDFSGDAVLETLNMGWRIISLESNRIGFVIGNLDIIGGTDNRIFLTFES